MNWDMTGIAIFKTTICSNQSKGYLPQRTHCTDSGREVGLWALDGKTRITIFCYSSLLLALSSLLFLSCSSLLALSSLCLLSLFSLSLISFACRSFSLNSLSSLAFLSSSFLTWSAIITLMTMMMMMMMMTLMMMMITFSAILLTSGSLAKQEGTWRGIFD